MTSPRRSPNVRRIAVVTGSRAEYGLLRSTMSAIARHPRLELHVVACGMHLLREFGSTVRQISRDGFRIDARVRMQRGDDGPLDQADGLARGVRGIARYLHASRCDVVLVLGDRIEALAGALAGSTTGRIVAHIHGGDRATGDTDDAFRHAISKLAHVHFAATRKSAARLRRMGENASRIHVVGLPGLDDVHEFLRIAPARPTSTNFALVIQHPTGRTADVEYCVMGDVLTAVRDAGLCPVVIAPNTDRGSFGIRRAIRDCRNRDDGANSVPVHASLPREEFLDLLHEAAVLVGNSSAGLLEAPLLGTPVVNVGDRQRGREAVGLGVVHVREDRASIARGINRILRVRAQTPRRSVHSRPPLVGERIARLLVGLRLDDRMRRKTITY